MSLKLKDSWNWRIVKKANEKEKQNWKCIEKYINFYTNIHICRRRDQPIVIQQSTSTENRYHVTGHTIIHRGLPSILIVTDDRFINHWIDHFFLHAVTVLSFFSLRGLVQLRVIGEWTRPSPLIVLDCTLVLTVYHWCNVCSVELLSCSTINIRASLQTLKSFLGSVLPCELWKEVLLKFAVGAVVQNTQNSVIFPLCRNTVLLIIPLALT